MHIKNLHCPLPVFLLNSKLVYKNIRTVLGSFTDRSLSRYSLIDRQMCSEVTVVRIVENIQGIVERYLSVYNSQ